MNDVLLPLKEQISTKNDIIQKLITDIQYLSAIKISSSITCTTNNNKINNFSNVELNNIETIKVDIPAQKVSIIVSVPNDVNIIDTNNTKITYKRSEPYLYAGGFGIIYKYISEINNASIVLKIGKDAYSLKSDINVINKLEKSGCESLVIPSFVIRDTTDRPYLLMEHVQGNLKDLADNEEKNIKNDHKTLVRIIIKIIEAFKCLMDLELYYTDCKLANILYRCFDDNNVEILLGDLGSAANKTDKNFVFTYPPIDLFNRKSKNPEESDVIWGLGIIYVQLLGQQINKFLSSKVLQRDKDKYKEFMEKIKKDLSNNNDYTIELFLINKLLNKFKTGRPNLETILQWFNQVNDGTFDLHKINKF